ncbi:MAG: hypothetical protein CM1200mP36_10160 [Gammaproteobacteria bacterium]|nr:MAG: hypothetical protein CM1200mP36_10160 [Gammaproteobacteria bacterium]
MPLLYALRDELGLNNPLFGCGLAQCGACTVLMDGQPTRAPCVVPVAAATGKLQTLNGIRLPISPILCSKLLSTSKSFCGYCVNGWIMYSVALRETATRLQRMRRFVRSLRD